MGQKSVTYFLIRHGLQKLNLKDKKLPFLNSGFFFSTYLCGSMQKKKKIFSDGNQKL